MSLRVGLGAFVALAMVSVATAALGDIKQIEKSATWSAHVLTEKKTQICFVYGEPSKKEGDYTSRGAAFVQVTHRPHENVANEVGFTAGYTFKQDSEAEVDVDGTKFTLFTHLDTAWGTDEKADKALIEAMKKGRELVIRGTSSRGTLTTDTYSLIGFTRAYLAIGKACKVD